MAVAVSKLRAPETIITQQEHAERRAKVMSYFGQKALVFIPGNNEIRRSPDVPYYFRQESNFRCLTGIDSPGVSAMLVPGEGRYILFAPEQTINAKVWDGDMPSHKELKDWYKADEVHAPDSLDAIARKYSPKSIHTLHAKSPFSVPGARKVVDGELADVMIEMRLLKSEAEIRAIEEALRITAAGFNAAMRATRPGKKERRIQALLEYHYRDEGASYAFPSIVTMDGNVLHNPEHRRQFFNQTLVDGRMLLMDSGAEIEGYSSDITRTIPISGKFNWEQIEIYDIVLRAKKAATDALKAGVSFKDIHLLSERVIAEGLKAISVLKGNIDDILASGAHRLFVAHGVGHAMGLDDHDIGEYPDRVAGYSAAFPRETDFAIKSLRFARVLVPGHVVTVEPGIYFISEVLNNPENRAKFKEFVDFEKAITYTLIVSGIRIEDDVLITPAGHRVLGPPIPQERNEIEERMQPAK